MVLKFPVYEADDAFSVSYWVASFPDRTLSADEEAAHDAACSAHEVANPPREGVEVVIYSGPSPYLDDSVTEFLEVYRWTKRNVIIRIPSEAHLGSFEDADILAFQDVFFRTLVCGWALDGAGSTHARVSIITGVENQPIGPPGHRYPAAVRAESLWVRVVDGVARYMPDADERERCVTLMAVATILAHDVTAGDYAGRPDAAEFVTYTLRAVVAALSKVPSLSEKLIGDGFTPVQVLMTSAELVASALVLDSRLPRDVAALPLYEYFARGIAQIAPRMAATAQTGRWFE